MIISKLSFRSAQKLINKDIIKDKKPLRDYAGFSDSNEARKTFSIFLDTTDISFLKRKLSILYERICEDINSSLTSPLSSKISFDFIRVDAFYYPKKKRLKIIEINSKNVGLHEVCTFLDEKVNKVLKIEIPFNLDDEIIKNQLYLLLSEIGEFDHILYISKKEIPRWTYFNKIADLSNIKVIDLEDINDLKITNDNLYYKDIHIKAIIRKFAFNFPSDLQMSINDLINRKKLYIVQPVHTKFLGLKDYLNNLNYSFIANSKIFDPRLFNKYISRKNSLVLKIKDRGGSKDIYIGKHCTSEEWTVYLKKALQDPQRWTLQKYITPAKNAIIPHSLEKPFKAPVLLGIFLLPDINFPGEFKIDIVAKAYTGKDEEFKFDPSSTMPEIYFGNIIIVKRLFNRIINNFINTAQ